MCYFDYQSAPNGLMKEKVQHWQEQKAQVDTVYDANQIIEAYVTHWQEPEHDRGQHQQGKEARAYSASESDENEEEQDHNYRHGAEYWESVD